ncbi:hypothetical protein KR032_009319 [Drosophila birchii]|nr:hypothetical protein KR032_009319 [Drosophila birchii]
MLKKYIFLLEVLMISLGSFCSCNNIFDENVIKTIEKYNEQIKAKELELKIIHSQFEAFLKELSENILNKDKSDVDNLSEVKKEVARLRVSLGHKEESLRTCEIKLGHEEDESKQTSIPENISSFWSQIIEMKEQGDHNVSSWDKFKQIPRQLSQYFSEN